MQEMSLSINVLYNFLLAYKLAGKSWHHYAYIHIYDLNWLHYKILLLSALANLVVLEFLYVYIYFWICICLLQKCMMQYA